MVPTFAGNQGDASSPQWRLHVPEELLVRGGWDHELIDGKLLARTILEQPVVLYKGESGQVGGAGQPLLPPRRASCRRAGIEGDCVRCMYHGLKFDPSGKCIQIPGQDMIPPKLGVQELSGGREASTWCGSGWAIRR